MKYAEVVRDLDANFSLSTAWRSYDTNFRLQKAADPTIPWDYFNMELWVWALSTEECWFHAISFRFSLSFSFPICFPVAYDLSCMRPLR